MKNPLEYVKRLKRLSRDRYPYEPLITVELSRERLIHNLHQFRAIAPRVNGGEIGRVAPVLKSNAYGHGLFEIANILESKEAQDKTSPIPFFIVDSYFEAIALRSNGNQTPILIVGYTRPETILGTQPKKIAFTITSIETLRTISKQSAVNTKPGKTGPIRLHLKIDTGMRRQGILPSEIAEAIILIKRNRNISLEGICSHFSDADNADHAFTEKQIAAWNEIVRHFKKEFHSLQYIHISATDGHRFSKKIEANVSRLGIGLYGLSDDIEFARKMHLQPVLQMKTIVTGTKPLKAGETTGYGNMFTAWKDTTIGTIPVGYFEGLNRKLSNNGSVIVLAGETRVVCPIVGRVSMNITTIEIPAEKSEMKNEAKQPKIGIGSKVIAISDNVADANSIASIAKKCGTIAYEIAVHIPAHLKRVVV